MAGNVSGNVSLQKYWNEVKSAEVLDGDIIKDGEDSLKKVNFGGSVARALGLGDRNVKTVGNQGRDARNDFYGALSAKLGHLDSVDATDTLKLVREELGISDDANGDKTTNKPLSRRLIRQVFDKVRAKLGETEFGNMGLKGPYVTGSGAKSMGGALALTEKQFKGIFEQIKDRGYDYDGFKADDGQAPELDAKKLELRKNAFNARIDAYLKMFKPGMSFGELERLFANGMDIDSIGKAVKGLVDKGECLVPKISLRLPTTSNSDDSFADIARNLNNMYEIEEKEGSGTIANKIKINLGPDDKVGQLVKRDADRDFVANLILNENPVDVKVYGFSGGDRIGRVLLSNLKSFRSLCDRVAQEDLKKEVDAFNSKVEKLEAQKKSAPGKKDEVLVAENSTLEALDKMDADLANGLRALIRKISAKCFSGLDLKDEKEFAIACQANMQNIFDLVAQTKVTVGRCRSVTIEQLIDKRLLALLDSPESDANSLKSKIIGQLTGPNGIESNQNDMIKYALQNALSTKDATKLRRMFSAGLRYPQNGGGFDPNAMLIGGGPYLHKTLQGANEDQQDVPADGQNSSMGKVLAIVRGALPPIDEEIVRASLFSLISGIEGVESATITKRTGAASIGETFEAKIKFKSPDKPDEPVIFKLQRPGSPKEFKDEVASVAALMKEDQTMLDSKKIEFGNDCDVIEDEFDFKKEQRNAVRGYAAYAIKDQSLSSDEKRIANRVTSMELVAKTSQEDLKAAIKTAKESSEITDDMVDKIVEKHLVAAQKTCMICKKAKGLTVDELLKEHEPPTLGELKNDSNITNLKKKDDPKFVQDGKACSVAQIEKIREMLLTKCEPLYQARQLLLSLAHQTIRTLQSGKPPYIHGDMHGGNLLLDLDADLVTEIDHGKAFSLTTNERLAFCRLIRLLNSSDGIEEGNGKRPMSQLREIVESYQACLEAELNNESTKEDRKDRIKTDLDKIGEMLERIDQGDDVQLDETNPNDKTIERLRSECGFGLDGLQSFRDILSSAGLYIPKNLSGTLLTFAKLNSAIKKVEAGIDRYKEVYYEAVVKNLDETRKENFNVDKTEKVSELEKQLGNNVPFDPMGEARWKQHLKIYISEGGDGAKDNLAGCKEKIRVRMEKIAAEKYDGDLKKLAEDEDKDLDKESKSYNKTWFEREETTMVNELNAELVKHGWPGDITTDEFRLAYTYQRAAAYEGEELMDKLDEFEKQHYEKTDVVAKSSGNNTDANELKECYSDAGLNYDKAISDKLGAAMEGGLNAKQLEDKLKEVVEETEKCEKDLNNEKKQVGRAYDDAKKNIKSYEARHGKHDWNKVMWSSHSFEKMKSCINKMIDTEGVDLTFGGHHLSLSGDMQNNDCTLEQIIDKALANAG